MRTLTVRSPRIADLRAKARYHRERLDLYKAKMYGLRPTTMTRHQNQGGSTCPPERVRSNPHAPWQHGSNGLQRQYWPKGTDFSTVTEAELDAVADEPNERPRKRLALANPPSASRSCCCNDPSKSAVCGTERTHDGSRDSTEAAAAPSATGPWAPGGRRPTRPRADLGY